MSSEPKKVDRRKFIYAGLGAVALVAIGAAAYVAMNPPVVTQTVTTSTTVTGTSTTKPGGSIKILSWQTPIDDMYKKLIQEDFTPKTGITVQYDTVPWGSYIEKNLVSMKGKSEYDLIMNNTEWTMPAWVYSGGLMPLNNRLKQDFKVDDFLPGFLGICAYPPGQKVKPTGYYLNFSDAVFYGVPYWDDAQPLLYRTDLVPEPPKNWDELLSIAQKLTNPDKKFYGYVFQGQPKAGQLYDAWFAVLHGFGADIFDDKLNPAFNTSEGIEGTQFLVDLYLKYKVVPPDTPALDSTATLDYYKGGFVAMIIPWGNSPLGDVPVAKVSKYDIAPVGKRVSARTAGAAFTIPSTASNPDGAWEYIKWALSPQIRAKIVGELGAPVVLKSELAYVKQGSNAWAVAQEVARNDIGVNPAIPNLTEVSDALSVPLNQALIGQISVKEALSQAEQKVKDVMKAAALL
jgi:multiple sugar transport system substrate-binding protein